jgi:hypothetical protein
MANERKIQDALLTVTKALPAAAASNSSDSIDLGSAGPAVLERVNLEISVPALPALVEDKTVTITIQDSADNSSFAAVTGLSTFVITGGVGNGAAAATRTVRLPPTTRRYINALQAVLTAGGDNTGVSVTYKLLT